LVIRFNQRVSVLRTAVPFEMLHGVPRASCEGFFQRYPFSGYRLTCHGASIAWVPRLRRGWCGGFAAGA